MEKNANTFSDSSINESSPIVTLQLLIGTIYNNNKPKKESNKELTIFVKTLNDSDNKYIYRVYFTFPHYNMFPPDCCRSLSPFQFK